MAIDKHYSVSFFVIFHCLTNLVVVVKVFVCKNSTRILKQTKYFQMTHLVLIFLLLCAQVAMAANQCQAGQYSGIFAPTIGIVQAAKRIMFLERPATSIVYDNLGNLYIGTCVNNDGVLYTYQFFATTIATNAKLCFVGKFNPSGSMLWFNQFSGATTISFALIKTTNNIIIAASQLQLGSISFNGTTINGTASMTNRDAYIFHVHTNGTLLTYGVVHSPSFEGGALSVQVDSTGSFAYVGGGFSGVMRFRLMDTSFQFITSLGDNDAFYAKYDIAATRFHWVKSFGGSM